MYPSPPPPPPYKRAPRQITTEEVQGYLDENQSLLMEVMEKIKLGKLVECGEHQERLQQNLMYLAAIADWQQPVMPPQRTTLPIELQEAVAKAQEQGIFLPNVALQFDNPHQQHQQAQEQGISPPNMSLQFDKPQDQLNQQVEEQGISPPNMPLQFGNPQHQLHQQAQEQGIFPLNMPLQFGNPQHQLHQQAQQQRTFLQNNGMYPMHSESALGAGSSSAPPSTAGPNDALGRSVQGASWGGDGQSNSAAVHNHSDIVSSHLKD